MKICHKVMKHNKPLYRRWWAIIVLCPSASCDIQLVIRRIDSLMGKQCACFMSATHSGHWQTKLHLLYSHTYKYLSVCRQMQVLSNVVHCTRISHTQEVLCLTWSAARQWGTEVAAAYRTLTQFDALSCLLLLSCWLLGDIGTSQTFYM